jgi:phenylacetate-CoA ligase
MDLLKYINRYILYPLYYFKSGDKRLARLNVMEKNQYLPIEDLDKLRLKNIQSIILYAYENTDYYRQLLDSKGVAPCDIKTLDDLAKIPPLTKADIQNNSETLLSKIFDRSSLIKDASGGSTGEPTVFYKNLEYLQLRAADQLRHDRWSGWDIGDRFALIWGAQRDLKASQSFREFIISRYVARIWELDAFDMNKTRMENYVKTLQKIKPKMVLGYANALVAFSEYLIKYHPDHGINPKGIISSAETLTESKRKIIESAFNCKVLNRYGSREVGLIASECSEQSGLHINADNIYVEIVKDGQPVPLGESGDILVTDFSNIAMPLIRYKLGDVGSLGENSCSCKRTLPILKSVEGRSGDFFVAADGSLVHGEYFTHLFYGEQDVKKFQMIQNTLEHVHLKIVSVNEDMDAPYIKSIIKKTVKILGEQCAVDIEFVSQIPPTASGKSLFTISKVTR